MPRKRIRDKRKGNIFNPERLNYAQRFFLKYGIVLSGTEDDLGFEKDNITAIKILWNKNKRDILSRFMKDVHHAGHRPWAFWKIEHSDYSNTRYDIKCGYGRLWKDIEYLREKGLLEVWELEYIRNNLQNEKRLSHCNYFNYEKMVNNYGEGRKCSNISCKLSS